MLGVVVAVSTVAAPSTQVIVVPACEQAVDCASALPDRRNIAVAVETLLRSARRSGELFILILIMNAHQKPFFLKWNYGRLKTVQVYVMAKAIHYEIDIDNSSRTKSGIFRSLAATIRCRYAYHY